MKIHEDKMLPPCPASMSGKNDGYNDLCKVTGEKCPFYEDEGMSICKSKTKCLNHFLKKEYVNQQEIVKLLLSDTKSIKNTSSKKQHKRSSKKHRSSKDYEVFHSTNEFIEEIEDALRKRESQIVDTASKIEEVIDERLLHIADEIIDELPEEISDMNFPTKTFESKSLLDEYKELGTVEEIKALKEKNTEKTPRFCGDVEWNGQPVYHKYVCPSCGRMEELVSEEIFYCVHCGQKIKIDFEEEGE